MAAWGGINPTILATREEEEGYCSLSPFELIGTMVIIYNRWAVYRTKERFHSLTVTHCILTYCLIQQ